MLTNTRHTPGIENHDIPSFSSGRENPTARNGSNQENKSLDNGLAKGLADQHNRMESSFQTCITIVALNSVAMHLPNGLDERYTHEALVSGTTLPRPKAGGAGLGWRGFHCIASRQTNGRKCRQSPGQRGEDEAELENGQGSGACQSEKWGIYMACWRWDLVRHSDTRGPVADLCQPSVHVRWTEDARARDGSIQ